MIGEREREQVAAWKNIVLDSVVVYGIVHYFDDVRWPECVESGLLGTQNQWLIRTSEL